MTLEHRPDIILLDANDNITKITQPENIVMKFGNMRIDVGYICYRKSGFYDSSLNVYSPSKRIGKVVDISTFEPSRRKVALAVIQLARKSTSSLKGRSENVQRQMRIVEELLNWGHSLNSLDDALTAGIELIKKYNNEVNKHVSRKTSRQRDRRAVIDVISQLHGVDKNTIRNKIPTIGKFDRKKSNRIQELKETNPNLTFRPSAFLLDASDKTQKITTPENVVIRINEQDVDIGALCYRVVGDYDTARRFQRKAYRLGRQVDPSTFDRSRREVALAVIQFARTKTLGSPATTYGMLSKQLMVLRELLDKGYSIDSIDNAITALREVTNDLNDRIARKKGSKPSLYNYRSAVIKLVAMIYDLSEKDINNKLVPLKGKTNPRKTNIIGKVPERDVRNRAVWAYLNIFTRVADGLMSNEPFPYCIDLRTIIEEHPSVWLGGLEASSQKHEIYQLIFSKFGQFPSWPEVESRYEKANMISAKSIVKTRYDQWVSTVNKANQPYSKAKLAMVNLALGAYFLSFVGTAALNVSVAKTLEDYDPLETEKTIKSYSFGGLMEGETPNNQQAMSGFKFIGLKGRAGGKEVYPEIGTQFVAHHNNYLKFLSWIEKEYSIDPSGLIFFALGSVYDDNYKNIELVKYPKASFITFAKVKNLIQYRTKGLEWIPPRLLRNAVSAGLLLTNPDPVAISRKLQNTPATVIKSYSEVALKDGHIMLKDYFDGLYAVAISYGRNHDQTIPVVMEDESKYETPIGGCDSDLEGGAALAAGFNENAPQPICGQAETCFFCTHYRAHADEEDIHNILSIQKLIVMARPRSLTSEHYEVKYTPIIYRIDEILRVMSEKRPELSPLIHSIIIRVNNGELSKHWQTHHGFILDLQETV